MIREKVRRQLDLEDESRALGADRYRASPSDAVERQQRVRERWRAVALVCAM